MKNGLCQSGMKMQIPQPGNNKVIMKGFHVSRSAERWRAPQQCLGLSEMPCSINFDGDYVKCSQSGAFISLSSNRLIFLEFTHGCVNWLVCTVVSAQYVLSLNLQTVFPSALKEYFHEDMWWFQSYFHKWSVPVIIGLIIFFFFLKLWSWLCFTPPNFVCKKMGMVQRTVDLYFSFLWQSLDI